MLPFNEIYSIRVIAFISALVLGSSMSSALAHESWSHGSGPGRFIPLPFLNNLAILDQETDLVWEKAPPLAGITWLQAHSRCNKLVIGNRMGWRLPTVQELTSVLDIGSGNPMNMTPGNPFALPWNGNTFVWTSTTSVADNTKAWSIGSQPFTLFEAPKISNSVVWCVRTGSGTPAQ